MKCKSCSLKFDNKSHIPMMLPQCGHSLCHQCLQHQPLNKEFSCVLCSMVYLNSAKNDFPVNESLLELISSNNKELKTKESTKINNSMEKDQNKNIQNRSQTEIIILGSHKKKSSGNLDYRSYSSKLSHSLASHTKQNLDELSQHISTTFKSKFFVF